MRSVVFLLFVLASTGCSLNYRYQVASATPLVGANETRFLFADLVDARSRPASPEARLELEQVRAAVREHASKAGLKPVFSAAPRSADDVNATLASAKAQGATEVVFLRYAAGDASVFHPMGLYILGVLPGLIMDLIPISTQNGLCVLEALVVDPASGDLLARKTIWNVGSERSIGLAVSLEQALHDAHRSAVRAVFVELVALKGKGWPARTHLPDLPDVVLSASMARNEGSRFVTPIWSIALPASATPKPAVSPAADPISRGEIVTTGWKLPSGVELNVTQVLQGYGAGRFPDSSPKVDGFSMLDVGPWEVNGAKQWRRDAWRSGLVIMASCESPMAQASANQSACKELLGSLRFTEPAQSAMR